MAKQQVQSQPVIMEVSSISRMVKDIVVKKKRVEIIQNDNPHKKLKNQQIQNIQSFVPDLIFAATAEGFHPKLCSISEKTKCADESTSK